MTTRPGFLYAVFHAEVRLMAGICARLNLPTPESLGRHAVPKYAMTSRLQDDKAADREAKKAEEHFRKEVYRLDKGICRCCLRKVRRTLERVVDRAEVHHVHGRLGKLRTLVRCALLLCAEDHERVTGTVGKTKLQVIGTKWFTLDGRRLIDARRPVAFKEVT